MVRVGDYYIKSDTVGFILGKMGEVKEETSKNFGKMVERSESQTYHLTIEQVVDKLMGYGAKEFVETSDLAPLLLIIKNAKRKIGEIIKLKSNGRK